jgi:hypothetical protein
VSHINSRPGRCNFKSIPQLKHMPVGLVIPIFYEVDELIGFIAGGQADSYPAAIFLSIIVETCTRMAM